MAACAWQAGLIDAFLLQPALAVLELNLLAAFALQPALTHFYRVVAGVMGQAV